MKRNIVCLLSVVMFSEKFLLWVLPWPTPFTCTKVLGPLKTEAPNTRRPKRRLGAEKGRVRGGKEDARERRCKVVGHRETKRAALWPGEETSLLSFDEGTICLSRRTPIFIGCSSQKAYGPSLNDALFICTTRLFLYLLNNNENQESAWSFCWGPKKRRFHLGRWNVHEGKKEERVGVW